ncbi:hypothetical protein F5Y19DRAFT_488780 [Xylariaceae sp. FL1651]|nr:hypothetical protein F5Y19DRAFT_488780 [Xylariaceae sp. FL1651]
MSILCCCHSRQSAGGKTHPDVIELPIQPPRARLSKTLSRSDTNMYFSTIMCSQGPSRLVTPTYQTIVDLEAVDVEDSDEDVPDTDTKESSTSTLGTFKTKLIRRLSHRVEAKNGSRQSLGTSNEEVARRAELKRLMHKRIQEELKSEEEDENIRPASLKQSTISNCKEPELAGGGPRDTIEFSVSDTNGQKTSGQVGALSDNSLFPPPVFDRQQKLCLRRSSCPDLVRRSAEQSRHNCSVSLKEIGSAVRLPPPPYLAPVYLSGGNGPDSPSIASWRLSYSTSQLGSYIDISEETKHFPRPQSADKKAELLTDDGDSYRHDEQKVDITRSGNLTGQEAVVDSSQIMEHEREVNNFSDQQQDETLIDLDERSAGRYSPLDVWLRSQGLHSTSVLSSRSNSAMTLERLQRIDDQEKRVVRDHHLGDYTSLPGNKSQIINHSSTLRDSALGAWPKAPETSAVTEESSISSPSNESVALQQVVSQMEDMLCPEGPSTGGHVQEVSSRYTSSRYTTRPNSQQATPRGSRLSLSEIFGSRRALQPLPPIYGPVSPYRAKASEKSGSSSYRTALNKTPSPDHARTKPETTGLPITEALAITISESASFKQREEELKSIEKRFGLTPTCRHPAAPMRSKFREEFNETKRLSSARNPLLSRLHLPFPKRARASTSHTKLNDKSIEGTENGRMESRRSRNALITNLDPDGDHLSHLVPKAQIEKSATGLWQRAIKSEADRRAGRPKAKLIKASTPSTDLNSAERAVVSMNDRNASSTKARVMEDGVKTPAESSFAPSFVPIDSESQKGTNIDDPIDMHDSVLQEWVDQVGADDARHQTESRLNIPKRRPPRLRTPPASWAKWPSHTRQERTTSAGVKDSISTKDFVEIMNTQRHNNAAADKALMKGREFTSSSRTLSSQIGKTLRSSWNKVVIHKDSLSRTPERVPVARDTRKSQEFLEYPELELLPTAEGYKEVRALEQQIDNMKRRSIAERRMIRQSSSESSKRPRTTRLAEEVHKIRCEDKSPPGVEIEYPAKFQPAAHLLTPSHALSASRSKSCTSELFGTPQSHLSYEDCVQIQMLGDDNHSLAKGQDATTIKRARSAGNIDINLPRKMLPMEKDADNDHSPFRGALKAELRRHKSLGCVHDDNGDHSKLLGAKVDGSIL